MTSICQFCTFANPIEFLICKLCSSVLKADEGGRIPRQQQASVISDSVKSFNVSPWQCKRCTFVHDAPFATRLAKCEICDEPRQADNFPGNPLSPSFTAFDALDSLFKNAVPLRNGTLSTLPKSKSFVDSAAADLDPAQFGPPQPSQVSPPAMPNFTTQQQVSSPASVRRTTTFANAGRSIFS